MVVEEERTDVEGVAIKEDGEEKEVCVYVCKRKRRRRRKSLETSEPKSSNGIECTGSIFFPSPFVRPSAVKGQKRAFAVEEGRVLCGLMLLRAAAAAATEYGRRRRTWGRKKNFTVRCATVSGLHGGKRQRRRRRRCVV